MGPVYSIASYRGIGAVADTDAQDLTRDRTSTERDSIILNAGTRCVAGYGDATIPEGVQLVVPHGGVAIHDGNTGGHSVDGVVSNLAVSRDIDPVGVRRP